MLKQVNSKFLNAAFKLERNLLLLEIVKFNKNFKDQNH